jgi:GYF domain 2
METLSGEETWYVCINEQEHGPIRFGHLAELAQQNRLREDDWVWKPGLASWIAARDVSGLFFGKFRSGQTQSNKGAPENKKPNSKSNLKTKATDQAKNFLIMFFYLWVVFGLLAVHESIILSQHQIDFKPHGLAFINALIFAKVMLVAEDLKLGRRLENEPLIYSILFKSILFAIALVCFHIMEHVVIGMWDGRTMTESIAEVGANKLKGIVSIGIIGTVGLVPFFILREISRVIGVDKFWSLFFRRRNP